MARACSRVSLKRGHAWRPELFDNTLPSPPCPASLAILENAIQPHRFDTTALDDALRFKVELHGRDPPTGFLAVREQILREVQFDALDDLLGAQSWRFDRQDLQIGFTHRLVFLGVDAIDLAGV